MCQVFVFDTRLKKTGKKGSNSTRIYKLNEMDADHVTAWNKGGTSDEKNCQMLCRYHNPSKGNK